MTNKPIFEVFVKGQPVTFESAFYTQDEATHYLRQHVADHNEFARDLLGRARLSELQGAWIHKLATDHLNRMRRVSEPQARTVVGLNLLPVIVLADKAADAQKRFPRITLKTGEGQTVVLQRAGKASTREGAVNVHDGGAFENRTWFGRIERDGTVTKGRAWTVEVEQLLRALAADPAKVAGQHGIATGECCFCGRPLSTAESRSVGYGPICAEKFGLPWGDTTVADEADAASKVCQHGHTTSQCEICSEPIDEAAERADMEFEFEAERHSTEAANDPQDDPFRGLTSDPGARALAELQERTARRRARSFGGGW